MDFFAEQDFARKRSRRLTVLFVLAVGGVAAAVYALSIVLYNWIRLESMGTDAMTGRYETLGPATLSMWEPQVFLFAVGGTLAVIAIGSLYKVAQLHEGGSAVAKALGGRRIQLDTTHLEERRLLNVIEEISIASGTPVPEVFLLDNEPGINAFAAGHSTSDAAIGVTKGTVQLLRRDELQGVIAHEFSHIFNGDARINLRAIGLLHGIFIVALLGRLVLRSMRHLRHTNSRKGGGAVALVGLFGLGLFAIGSVGVFFGRMIQSAISRQREVLADASAVQFTRDAGGLANALKKIGGATSQSYLTSPQADEASHMFFSEAIRRLPLFASFFRTHPPLAERIRKLDPSWDGSFPEVTLPDIAEGFSAEPRQATAGRAVGLTGELAAGAAGPPVASRVAGSPVASRVTGSPVAAGAVDQAIDHIGQPRMEEIAYAQSVHGSLPDNWVQAARQPAAAQAMVFGLLLAQDERLRASEVRTLQKLTDPKTAELSLRFHTEAASRPSVEKIAIVEIAIAALRHLSASEYQRFCKVVKALSESDHQITLFEYTLSRIIQRHLGRHFGHLPRPQVKIRTLRSLVPDAEVLISTLARVGGRDDGEVMRAFQSGTAALNLKGWSASLRPVEECRLKDVDSALQRYDMATPVLKKSLMLACAATVMADRRVTDREAELIRAIGDAIDCPVPPFVRSVS